MKNLWNDNDTKNFKNDLDYRVYTSNLLGRSDELVLHGGGNTSVKSKIDGADILYVKGSGWDLVDIKAEGFAGVELSFLIDMAKLEKLSDTDMVAAQREAMIDKTAPNPSVEAILHAIIPFKFVDHTHADAVVTISNSEFGESLIKNLFPEFLVIPYIMPGFDLAHTIYTMVQGFNWDSCEGIILLNHGIFTFDDNPRTSYAKMIYAVTQAENFLEQNAPLVIEKYIPRATLDLNSLQTIIDKEKGYEVSIKIDQSPLALHYASSRNLSSVATRGVLTPEHIIRTKRVPAVLENNDIQACIDNFKEDYINYFEEFKTDEICLNKAPNYMVVKNFGVVYFGKNEKEVNIINDIITHTMSAILKADILGGYKSISIKDSFDMEYWELEQNKLKANK
ncbi:MAG: class II aldolase/adducin family protein [Campylobacterota bacterium]|nr:class II aldolase/adducin family protein [Campylobacterota bacterium]